ncbi:DUF350 domain-containing protein [Ochrovirga pacifica]|uniref:DUF350 domain-containing protein n=1 Tax=Ochrovirga pacifica TaxID=1042376 RepID=UPI0002557F90|nr:DUF350 domain-containing protein [Ochrovirga pacifica]
MDTAFDFTTYFYSAGYVLSGLLIFVLGKLAYKFTHSKINIQNELVEKDNFAFILSYIGYFIGLLITIGGSIIGESYGFWIDIEHIFIYGTLSILLLQISNFIANKLILPKFDLKKEIIIDQNEGTGIIEAIIYVVNGLILYGALVGESETLTEGILTFVIYWAIGNIMLVLTSKIYGWWLDYNIHEQIEKDNVAAGIAFGGALLAIGIIIMNALIAPFEDWTTTIIDISIQMVLATILLPIMRFFADTILLPGQKLTDEIVHQEKPNLGAGLVEAFAYAGSAVLISWCL